MERRKHRRVPARVKGVLQSNSYEVEGRTLDLSLGGARIESELEVYPGKQVVIRLMLPGVEKPLSIEQALVRWTSQKTFGVEFTQVKRKELDELEQLIEEFEEYEAGGHA